MNQSRGLGDSIVAQWMVCANFCNTIGTSETYEVGQLWSAVGVTPDIRPLTAQDRVLPEAVICRTEIPQRSSLQPYRDVLSVSIGGAHRAHLD